MSSPLQREAEIFAAALEIESPADREAFLASACGDDAAIRGRIERLLGRQREAEGFFNRPPPASSLGAGLPAASVPATPPATGVEKVGDWIRQFRLLQKLGEGGGGVVYLAEQTEPVRRRVALKILKPGMDTRAVIARFEAERQALALMDHPHIARVLDAGATELGRPFFVMEYVRGIPILEYCDGNQVPVRERLTLFVQVCQAIQHAHQKGIIHRDIKPTNILVTAADGMAASPKVIDFGVAKAITSLQLTDKTLFTQFELLIGTPAYMSPEQADLNASDIDTRSDIYSLGVLLYELLTGRPPFESKALLDSGVEAMRRTIRETAPPRPSTHLRTLSEEQLASVARNRQTEAPRLLTLLRGDLDWIVLKAIAKDRTRRYETANALAMDVRRFLDNQPVLARPPSRAYEFRKLARRHRPAVMGAAAVALALLAGVVLSSSLAVRARHAEREHARLRQRAEQATAEAERHRIRSTTQAYASDMKAASVALDQNNRGQALQLLRRYLPGTAGSDLRGIEWRYLWQAARSDEDRTFQLDRIISTVAYSPDGRRLAVGHMQNEVSVMDPVSGETLKRLPGMTRIISHASVAWMPDGRLLAVGRDDSVVLHETVGWKAVRELPGPCLALAISPDGRRLARAGPRGIFLYDTRTWETNRLLDEGPESRIMSRLTFTADSRRLVAARRERRSVDVWDLEPGGRELHLRIQGQPLGLAVSPDSRWVADLEIGGRIQLWDLATGELRWLRDGAHTGWGFGLAFSADSRFLVTGGGDQMVHIWEIQESTSPVREQPVTLRGHENEIWALTMAPDGVHIATGGKDASVRIWRLDRPPDTQLNIEAPPGALILDSEVDSPVVRALLPGRIVAELDLGTGETVRRVALDPDAMTAMNSGSVVQVGKDRIYSATTKGMLDVRSLIDGKAVQQMKLGDGPIAILKVSPDGRYLFGRDDEAGRAGVWDLIAGQPIAWLTDFSVTDAVHGLARAKRVAFSPDSRLIAYATTNFALALWDIEKRQPLFTLPGHAWNIFCIRFSPDGSLLASSSWDGRIRRWDPRTGREAGFPLSGHFGGVHNLAFSSDGRTLISSADDSSVRFWNVATGSEMLSVPAGQALWSNTLFGNGAAIGWQFGLEHHRLRITRVPSLAEIDASVPSGPAR